MKQFKGTRKPQLWDWIVPALATAKESQAKVFSIIGGDDNQTRFFLTEELFWLEMLQGDITKALEELKLFLKNHGENILYFGLCNCKSINAVQMEEIIKLVPNVKELDLDLNSHITEEQWDKLLENVLSSSSKLEKIFLISYENNSFLLNPQVKNEVVKKLKESGIVVPRETEEEYNSTKWPFPKTEEEALIFYDDIGTWPKRE